MSGYLEDIFTIDAAACQKAGSHTVYLLMSGGKTLASKHGVTWRFRRVKQEHWTASQSCEATEAENDRGAE